MQLITIKHTNGMKLFTDNTVLINAVFVVVVGSELLCNLIFWCDFIFSIEQLVNKVRRQGHKNSIRSYVWLVVVLSLPVVKYNVEIDLFTLL